MIHIRRETVPWRPPSPLSECGRDETKNRLAMTSRAEWLGIRAAWYARIRAGEIDLRARHPDLCRNCWDTAGRWKTWDDDPVECTVRTLEFDRDESELELATIAEFLQTHAIGYADMLRRNRALRALQGGRVR